MLGGQMAGGGVGVAPKEELVLMHCVLEMGQGTDPQSLRRFAPLFVEAVEKWREIADNITKGIKVDISAKREEELKKMQQQSRGGDNIKPGGQFMKI